MTYKTGNLPSPFPRYGVETVLSVVGGTGHLRYHNTTIAGWSDGAITLRTGGWHTLTTKKRLNDLFLYLHLPYRIYQRAGLWYVGYDNGTSVLFREGIRLRMHEEEEVFNPCI